MSVEQEAERIAKDIYYQVRSDFLIYNQSEIDAFDIIKNYLIRFYNSQAKAEIKFK